MKGTPPGRWESRLLALLLFLAPLAVWTPAVDSFVLPKWTMLAWGALALACALIVGALGRLSLRIHLHPVNGALILGWLWTMISVSWASSRDLAWQEVRRDGIVLAFALLAQSLLHGRRDRILLVAKSLGAASLVVACWTVFLDSATAFGWIHPTMLRTLGDWRDVVSMASFGNSGHVGDFVAVGFLAWMGTFLLARTRAMRTLAVAALMVHAAALIVAWSVHSNLSLIVASAVLVISLRGDLRLFRWKRNARRWVGLAAGFAAVVAFYVVDHPGNPHGSRIWHGSDESASGGIFAQAFASPRWHAGGPTRLAIWLTTLDIVRENPWFGVGAGCHPYVYPATVSPIVAGRADLAPFASRWTNAAHNDLLQRWSETGIIGLFLLVGAIGMSWKRAHDRMKDASPATRTLIAIGAAMLVAQVVQMQFSFPLQLPVSKLLFALLLAMPEMIPTRGGSEPFLVLVQRHIGPMRLRVALENMQIPREIGVTLPLSVPVRAGVAVPVLALATWMGWRAAQPLRADCAYREARTIQLQANMFGGALTGESAKQYEAACVRTLAIWPGHTDCRSGLSDLYVRQQRWKEALGESLVVIRKLNATEVHVRLAMAYRGLGMEAESQTHAAEVERRLGRAKGGS